jgi:hypothetical protein
VCRGGSGWVWMGEGMVGGETGWVWEDVGVWVERCNFVCEYVDCFSYGERGEMKWMCVLAFLFLELDDEADSIHTYHIL